MTISQQQVRKLSVLAMSAVASISGSIVAYASPPVKTGTPAIPTRIQYNRDIRPILSDNCFSCHGADSGARKAGLRLDKPATDAAIKDGSAAIVPGKPEASEAINRILGKGPLMPPAFTHKTLKPEQIALLKAWVKQGAQYQPHWAYIAPQKPALPVVANTAWAKSPIDRFILVRLEQAGLKPAPEADRRTLVRRVSLDVTGLPPEPAEVARFVNDYSTDAYEKMVDRFLTSSRYGEHRARYWLDVARYADTNGIHFDNYREVWAYRDWVINAYNKNMPFDQFTIEQLAGDLLPKPTLQQKIATGFTRCNITTNEGGAIDEEYRVLYARDRTETASQIWMGSTMGCCVCHDHKFDPFSMKDFYSMSAFFNNTTQNAMDGNVKDTPPIMFVPAAQDTARYTTIAADVAEAQKAVDARKANARADFDSWIKSAKPEAVANTAAPAGLVTSIPLNEGKGRNLAASVAGTAYTLTAGAEPAWDTGSVAEKAFTRTAGASAECPLIGDFDTTQAFSYAAWIKMPKNGVGGAVFARMDDEHDFRGWDMWLEFNKVGTHIINKWPESALKVVTRQPLSTNQWHHVCIAYPGTGKAGDVRIYVDGKLVDTDVASDNLRGTIKTTVPFKIGQRHTTAGTDGLAIQDIRLYNRVLDARDVTHIGSGPRTSYLVAKQATLTPAERDEAFNWWLSSADKEYTASADKLAALQAENAAIMGRGTTAHVANEKPSPAMAFILNRGEYDKRRDQVTPATPASLPAIPASFPKNRLGLAKWFLLPENPLTARVTVNRMWQEIFGIGLVKSAGDFGVNGEIPLNQPLLDYLAVDFREHNWDMKRMYRQILLSSTYRQSAAVTADKKRLDPDNRLVSRGPRFRMDAEMIRDYALAASTILSSKVGGPSVRPYQPAGVWEAVAMPESNTRNYKQDMGESLYRRSMYTFWKRAAPPASMDVFNAPNRETCTVRRDRTNTPLQALVTLNDIQFVEAARNLAQRTLKEGGSTDLSRINFLSNRLLARPFSPAELAIVQKSLKSLAAHYASDEKDAKELVMTGESRPDASIPVTKLAAWTMLANQLMNLDEVLNK